MACSVCEASVQCAQRCRQLVTLQTIHSIARSKKQQPPQARHNIDVPQNHKSPRLQTRSTKEPQLNAATSQVRWARLKTTGFRNGTPTPAGAFLQSLCYTCTLMRQSTLPPVLEQIASGAHSPARGRIAAHKHASLGGPVTLRPAFLQPHTSPDQTDAIAMSCTLAAQWLHTPHCCHCSSSRGFAGRNRPAP